MDDKIKYFYIGVIFMVLLIVVLFLSQRVTVRNIKPVEYIAKPTEVTITPTPIVTPEIEIPTIKISVSTNAGSVK
jgi:hypothetical protein